MNVSIFDLHLAVEDALFEEVPYRPWVSPLGAVPVGVSHGDRRVVGRVGDELVSVTDLPPHIVHRSEPGALHAYQWFERGRDFLDWVQNTAAGTRFFGQALDWDDVTKRQAAAQAVRIGLEWDSEGNILVQPPPGYRRPIGARRTKRFRLAPPAAGNAWDVNAADEPSSEPLVGPGLSAVLDLPLHDVCCPGDPFTFEVELPPDGELAAEVGTFKDTGR